LLVGLWQEVTPRLTSESFDSILFDTYPLTAEEIHGNHFSFFSEAFRLLRPGGIFSYYSDEADELEDAHVDRLVTAGFRREDITSKPYAVTPPKDCEYWQATSLVVPIVKKSFVGS
jgi:guanidinoacetate N-methyltransferase